MKWVKESYKIGICLFLFNVFVAFVAHNLTNGHMFGIIAYIGITLVMVWIFFDATCRNHEGYDDDYYPYR